MSTSEVPSILLLDTSPTLRKRILTMLSLRGIHVLLANSDTDALRKIENASVSLVLINLNSTGIDGPAFTRRCRQSERLQNVSIILLTSPTESCARRQELLKAGANQCLMMPLNESDFVKTVFQYIKPQYGISFPSNR
jgi:CheY-like chemotaxis protein